VNGNKKITIVLADHHQIVRQGVQALLEADGDIEVVGETGDGITAVKLIKKTKPDVAILELMMPGLNGIDVARQVVKRAAKTKIVILSMQDDENLVVEALRAGAWAYVLKTAGSADLVRAVRDVVQGNRYLSPPLYDRAERIYKLQSHKAFSDTYDLLTKREREVLHLSAEGLTNKKIAMHLGISLRTAETHRANAMSKLDIHNQADLTRYAIRRGIISVQ
jgi:two-component system, NarL family, response regulator NreC